MDETTVELEKLQEIINHLPEESSLTPEDLLMIYRIAKLAQVAHNCPFDQDKREMLSTIAGTTLKTQKIASVVIITGLVTGMMSGIWYMVTHTFMDLVKGK
jgi:predicted secreted protein